MRYAVTMIFLSLSLLTGAFAFPAIGVAFAWASFSFFLVALSYSGLGPRVLGKRNDGSMSLVFKTLNLPFLLFTWFIWHSYRILSREDKFNAIGDDLVIGRRLLPSEVPGGFAYYIDLTSEFEDPWELRSTPRYRCLPILDASVPSLKDLQLVLDSIGAGKIYVHCAQGHGRSALFALALLRHRGEADDAHEGLARLQGIRPGIKLNRGQRRFVDRYFAQGDSEEGAA